MQTGFVLREKGGRGWWYADERWIRGQGWFTSNMVGAKVYATEAEAREAAATLRVPVSVVSL